MRFRSRYATRSNSPSTICCSSSALTRPSRLPNRSVEKVRICEIFTHEGLGMRTLSILQASGKLTAWLWLVIAKAMTVPERSLKMS